MTCALCYRPSHGFGWVEPRRRLTLSRQRWRFCSRRCLDIFIELHPSESHMLDPIAMKKTALSACLKPLGDYAETVGLQRPLADYNHDEILELVDTVVIAYQDSMQIQYEKAVAQERLGVRS